MIQELEANNQNEEGDWETASEKHLRIQHENVDRYLTLLLREPSMNTFPKNLDLADLVAISCIYKKTANIIRNLFPKIEKLYSTFDFNQIFDNIRETSRVRECILHFRPHSIIIGSKLTCNLPVDLLHAFILFEPYELTIQIRGMNQQFLVSLYPLDIKKLRFECPNKLDKGALSLNSLLQSMTKIESLELIGYGINDFTAITIGNLCLEELILNDVRINCKEIDILVMYLSRQRFLKNLKLRYIKEFYLKERLFFGKVMKKIKNVNRKFRSFSKQQIL